MIGIASNNLTPTPLQTSWRGELSRRGAVLGTRRTYTFRMAHIERRMFIRAPQQRVWDVVSDLSGQKRWMVDVRSLDIVSETKSGVGTTLDLQTELYGIPLLHDLMDVVTWEEPREIGVVHRGAFTGTAFFRLEPVPGGTVFVWVEDFKPPLGPLGELGFVVAVRSHLRKVWSRSMDNVRLICEGQLEFD
jgi:hypothetical protein